MTNPDAFDKAMDYLLGNEGTQFTDNPNDSGGPTKFGVTKGAFEEFIEEIISIEDFKLLTIDSARTFYHLKYWMLLSCDKINDLGVAIAIFDCGVLYGVRTASYLTQKTLNQCGSNLKTDAVVGPKTVAALNSINVHDFISTLNVILISRINLIIRAHPKDEVFRKGWTSRANRLLTLEKVSLVIEGNT